MAERGTSGAPKRRGRPPTLPEDREKLLQSLAYDVVEKQLLKGEVSSQLLTMLIKGGGTQGALELENLRNQNRLLVARVEGMESMKRMEADLERAFEAFRTYSGDVDDDHDE